MEKYVFVSYVPILDTLQNIARIVHADLPRKIRKKVSKMKTKEQRNKKLVSKVPLGKIWRIKEDSKYIEEIKISNISEVSKDDYEHNYATNKNGIHYKEKQDGDVKGYTNKNEGDEEGCSDDCGILS